MRVVAALSGGVDSAVAAALLREQGHHVVGVYLRNGIAPGRAAARAKQGCCGVVDAADAARVADALDVPYYALDFAEAFDALIGSFADDYAAGRTPNPCILCNRDLKFGRLLQFAASIGAEAVATGHYAALEDRDGRRALRMPADRAKDQTYVLFPLTQHQLARTVFPLAGLTKTEVRAAARSRGLPVAEKPESMEICFVPDGDYRDVLARRAPEALRPGDVVDGRTGAVLGTHGGVGTVTIGQRRGIGVSGPEPLYVTRIEVATNRVVVGGAGDCAWSDVVVESWNAVSSAAPSPEKPLRGRAKVRRSHEPQCAVAESDGGGVVRVKFQAPVRAPSPGQALVLYDDAGYVLGGGWISAGA